MKSELIPIGNLKLNPSNPRDIKKDKFEKLKKSLKDSPWMLEARPLVVDEDLMVLGGNMRLRAALEMGIKELPVIQLKGLTEEQKQEFIIKDNVSFGDWDWDVLANEWDEGKLSEWGLDVPEWEAKDDLHVSKKPVIKVTFPTPEELQQCESEIQEVINRISPDAYYSVSV